MPTQRKGLYKRRLEIAASIRGKRMAKARWEAERARRDKIASLDAEKYPSKIVRRIIVIDDEKTVREAVIFSFDSRRSASAKLRKVLTFSA